MTHKTVNLNVPTLTRVEGEGAMHVTVRDGVVEDVRLEIYEPPRMFEAFLRGRAHTEPVDITARICGICPVAYQMSSAHAIESIAGVRPGGAVRELRRLLYCGEWIESHVLHMAFLHAPDFVGVDSGIEIAQQHPELMAEVLHLKKTGNRIMEVVGGRPIHPVNVRLGGFYRAPSRAELDVLLPDLDRAHAGALALLRWVATFEFPSIPDRLAADTEYVSLRHEHEYPFNEGRMVSNRGLDLSIEEFGERLHEYHVAHSTALHAVLDGDEHRGRHYQTGPLARWMNSADLVPASIRDVADELGVAAVETNPFRSILVRGLETLWAVEEAQRIIRDYRPPARPALEVPAVAGTAAPRRRAGRSTTATRSTPRARSSTPSSSHRRARTRTPSSATCATSSRPTSTSTTTRSVIGASRSSATTTRASPARRTSCGSRSTGADVADVEAGPGRRLLVIGVGNRDRGDDAVGPVVCDLLAGASGVATLVVEGSVVDLPIRWTPDDRVVIVDAAAPAGRPGRITEVDALADRLVAPGVVSTHTIDVGAAVELARAMGRMPAELTIVGVEGASFGFGDGLGPEVHRAAERVAADLSRRAGRAAAAR